MAQQQYSTRTVWVASVALLLVALAIGLWPALAQDHPPVSLSAWQAHQLSVSSAADVLTSSITPSKVGNFRLTVTIPTGSTASLVGYTTAPSVGGAILHSLNQGVALTVGSSYTFTWGATPNWSYNLQFATATTAVYELDLIYNGVN